MGPCLLCGGKFSDIECEIDISIFFPHLQLTKTVFTSDFVFQWVFESTFRRGQVNHIEGMVCVHILGVHTFNVVFGGTWFDTCIS